MSRLFILFILLAAFSEFTNGQDHSHMNHPADPAMIMSDTSMPGMAHSMHHEHKMGNSPMCHSLSLNLPMSRIGSGTSWLPDETSMYGYMAHTKKWKYMFYGNIFIRYDKQDISGAGSRGGEIWDAPNMIMAMGQTHIGDKGLFHFNDLIACFLKDPSEGEEQLYMPVMNGLKNRIKRVPSC